MALTIYNNVPALTSQRYVGQTNSALSKNLEKLSSGLRINSAADDASGLAISEKLRGQISGLQRASMNAQDGISLLQTAEGGLSVITDMAQRMRELAVQAGNGVYTTSDRAEIQKEVDQLKDEIDRVAASTEFNTKNLLNGDSTALWSTDKSDVIDAAITGAVAEGSYNLEIDVTAGKNYVYNTDIMSLKEGAIAADITTANGTVNSSNMTLVSDPTSLASGTAGYTLGITNSAAGDLAAAAETISVFEQSGSSFSVGAVAITNSGTGTVQSNSGYLEIRFEETVAAADASTEDVSISYRLIDSKTGTVGEWTSATLSASGSAGRIDIVSAHASFTGFSETTFGSLNITASITLGADGSVQTGDKIFISVSQGMEADNVASGGGTVQLTAGPLSQDGPRIAFTSGSTALTKADNGDNVVDYNNVTVYHATMDTATGNVDVGSLTLNFKENTGEATANGTTLADTAIEIKVSGAGEAATSSTKLSDVARFTTSDGRNIFDETQELTIYGNGKSATIYLEGDDTISDFETKLNSAIVDDLGMGATAATSSTVSDVNNNLVNYVGTADDLTNEAVKGTFVIQSAKLGDDSQLSFIGNQALIDGLSLSTIQEGENSEIEVTVTDAHNGATVSKDSVNDYTLKNVIDGVNVFISSDAGVNVAWDSTDKELDFTSGSTEEVKLHVVDNAMEMQIGANEGQTILASIPQIDTKALGLEDVVMVDQERAQEAITKIDSALESISSTRATIGAQINRLEYTIVGLDTARENLTASESRIRDLDFASEMTEFTRNQILNQAGVAMLSQANNLPNLALQLLG